MYLGGYMLPKGTHISIDQYSLNHNPKYWSNPMEFLPERFKDIDDFTAKWGLFRFGFGGRRCPGQYYANLVISNTIARLFSQYHLRPISLDNVKHHQQMPLLPGHMTMMPDCLIKLEKKLDSNMVNRSILLCFAIDFYAL